MKFAFKSYEGLYKKFEKCNSTSMLKRMHRRNTFLHKIEGSPLLFIIVLEALSKKFRKGLPYELLYADDLVLIAESEELLVEKIEKWRKGL